MSEICQIHGFCAYTCQLKHLAPGVRPHMKVLWNPKFLILAQFCTKHVCLYVTIHERNPVRIPVHTSNFHTEILNSDFRGTWCTMNTMFSLQCSARFTVTSLIQYQWLIAKFISRTVVLKCKSCTPHYNVQHRIFQPQLFICFAQNRYLLQIK